jgi:hypothetical protein
MPKEDERNVSEASPDQGVMHGRGASEKPPMRMHRRLLANQATAAASGAARPLT